MLYDCIIEERPTPSYAKKHKYRIIVHNYFENYVSPRHAFGRWYAQRNRLVNAIAAYKVSGDFSFVWKVL